MLNKAKIQEYKKNYVKTHGYWYLTNKDKWKITQKRYRDKNRPLIRLQARESYQRNRKKRLRQTREKRLKIRLEMMDLLGGRNCKLCGFSNLTALQFDHLGNNGNLKRKYDRSNFSELRILLKNPVLALKTLQVLCGNCHNIKTYGKYYNVL